MGSHMGPSCRYLSALFPAANIGRLAWWPVETVLREALDIWLYFIIWNDKITVYKIIHCNSIYYAIIGYFSGLLHKSPLSVIPNVIVLFTSLCLYCWLHRPEPFLRICQLCNYIRISQHYIEPKCPVPCSQEPSTGPLPDQSSHTTPSYLSKIHLNIVTVFGWIPEL
jgi:hypothetical protein